MAEVEYKYGGAGNETGHLSAATLLVNSTIGYSAIGADDECAISSPQGFGCHSGGEVGPYWRARLISIIATHLYNEELKKIDGHCIGYTD